MSINVVKRSVDAIIPTRAHPTDIGLDLVAIRVHKIINQDVIMYDTGLAATAPNGYYMEIIPRSSISKTGWMLANSLGVIDPDYTGNLYIVMVRVVPSAEELPLPPFTLCQLVLRKAEYATVTEVSEVDLLYHHSERGVGGFGSSGDRLGYMPNNVNDS